MTVTPSLDLAPGCFGLAMTYRAGARECAACPFAANCEPLASSNLATLREELGIKVEPVVKTKVAPIINGDHFVADTALPKKVNAHLERLDRLGIKVTPALARGENPFIGQKPGFLRIACHLLLKKKTGYSREKLVECFVKGLGHTPETAAAHAKQAVQILEALGAAHELNGLIQMKVGI